MKFKLGTTDLVVCLGTMTGVRRTRETLSNKWITHWKKVNFFDTAELTSASELRFIRQDRSTIKIGLKIEK